MIRFPIMQKELKTQEKNTSAGKERPAGTKKTKDHHKETSSHSRNAREAVLDSDHERNLEIV